MDWSELAYRGANIPRGRSFRIEYCSISNSEVRFGANSKGCKAVEASGNRIRNGRVNTIQPWLGFGSVDLCDHKFVCRSDSGLHFGGLADSEPGNSAASCLQAPIPKTWSCSKKLGIGPFVTLSSTLKPLLR